MKGLLKKGLSILMATIMFVTAFTVAPFTVSAVDGDPDFVFEKSYNSYDGTQLIKLVGYNGSDENVVIPERVPDDYPDESMCGRDFSIIRESAFYGNTNIKSVTIQDNVNHIAGSAFCGCSNLEEVTIGTNLDHLGNSCFASCPALSKVTIYSVRDSFQMLSLVFGDSPNVTVYGYHGSQVEAGMLEHYIPFVGLDHTYGAPVWSWNGYSSATASFTCSYGDVTQDVEATITSEIIKEPTSEENGEEKFTASVTFENQPYSDSKIRYFSSAASVTLNGSTSYFVNLKTASKAENWVEGSTLTLLADADITETVTVPSGAHTLDLNGFGIRAAAEESFGVITIPEGAELTLNDSGSATHKYSVNDSLATVDDSLEGESVLTFTGGYITGGKGNSQSGGAVYNSGVFTMNGGTLIGNKVSEDGGGIFNGGTVNLAGGQIIYNAAQKWGGGIYMTDTVANTVNLSGGSITNNLCNNNGGGIQVSANDKVYISGDPVVKDNYVTNGSINNINLSDGIIAVTGQLDSDASVGVRRYNGEGGVITVSENTELNKPDCFISDVSDLVVGKDVTSGQLKLHSPYTVTWKNDNGDVLETDTDLAEGDIPQYNGSTPVKPGDEQGLYVFEKWSPDVTTAAADATYTATYTQVSPVAKVGDTLYGTLAKAVENWVEGSTLTLLADADITESVTVPAGAHTLDLNGYGIRATGSASFSVITVPQGAELTLIDSGNTTHKYSVDESGLATVDDSLEGENIPTFSGGYITGGKGNDNHGGGFCVRGTLTVNAGTIIGNKAGRSGGGIDNYGTVNLAGGQIIYNTASNWGGGIYMENDQCVSVADISGGLIADNTSGNNGGGIHVSADARVNVSGNPVIRDNHKGNSLNNVNLADGGFISVTDQLGSGASVGVRKTSVTGEFTVSENTDYNTAASFISDNSDLVIGKDATSGQLKLHAPYTITWKNYNDIVLETDTNVREGDLPAYNGATPTKPNDESGYYVFDKWTPDITAATADAAYTATFTRYDAVAKVGDTLYLSFPEAVEAADGADVILLADISEPYTLDEEQVIRVVLGSHQLTVNAPEGEFRLKTSQEGDTTVYSVAKLYAEVNGTKYESFSEAAAVAGGTKDIILLRDMASAFSMYEHNSDILRVKSNGFEANVTDYVRTENKNGVTYYYKKNSPAYVDGDGIDDDDDDGNILIPAGAAAVIEAAAIADAITSITIGTGATVVIEGTLPNDVELEPENPEEECLEEEEKEDGTKEVKNLKYHWVNIDTGISILDAGAEVLPDCINDLWATYNQNIASIIKITPPVLNIIGYTDVRIAFPYPDGWYFPPIPYLPESMNPGSHFVAFFENASFDSYGTPFLGKIITEDLEISGLWIPYEAAVIKPDGSLEYYLTFEGAAENRDGNIVQILSAPLTSYTLKKIGDIPLVYEVLRVKRGYYMGGSHVDEPSGVPEGYGMRTWTYTDEEGEVVTCYTIDGAFTATFVYNNGTPDTTQTVYSNQLVERPKDPAKPGAIFLGWYSDEQLTQPFDFTQPVYSNVTLYAKWQESSPVTGSYKFKYIDRYGDEKTKTVEVTLNEQEINGYSGNSYQAGIPTYIWTEEAKQLFEKNPLVTAALAVTGNSEDDQQNVSVYKNDVEWDLIKLNADDATNMTTDLDENSLTVYAQTKPHVFTINYYFVKDGNTEYRGTRTDVEYGKPVTFSPEYNNPEKYEYIEEEIPQEGFCYWSADEAGLIPITTNRTFGMLLRGKWVNDSEDDRVVDIYAQYNNNLTDDWMPLIEEAVFTHTIEDDNDWVYLDYMTNYLSKDGTVVKKLVENGDENIRYGLIAVKHPVDSPEITREEMIDLTQSMISNESAAIYTDDSKQAVAYRFEYGKQSDSTKPISNFNRVLYTLRSDTEKAENNQFSVMAYITVDGVNYYYSEVNNDINVHELLSE